MAASTSTAALFTQRKFVANERRECSLQPGRELRLPSADAENQLGVMFSMTQHVPELST